MLDVDVIGLRRHGIADQVLDDGTRPERRKRHDAPIRPHGDHCPPPLNWES